MITTDHHGPHEGNSGRGTSSGPVSADTVSRASPDLPACYGGGMSADKTEELNLGGVIACEVSASYSAYIVANPPPEEDGPAGWLSALQTGMSLAVAEQLAMLWMMPMKPAISPATPAEAAEFILKVAASKRELRAQQVEPS